ncbi:hypothetical protein E3N88_23657 [Mikania micrantha]|uniref:Uncharacterized protein n=1 Tax=Mikania micrantha TaxID=192012 RepID=A0A5N6NDW1_9ASTR|nr:hypothetical protein E3N88_23657 [Mikania micrantha]
MVVTVALTGAGRWLIKRLKETGEVRRSQHWTSPVTHWGCDAIYGGDGNGGGDKSGGDGTPEVEGAVVEAQQGNTKK